MDGIRYAVQIEKRTISKRYILLARVELKIRGHYRA